MAESHALAACCAGLYEAAQHVLKAAHLDSRPAAWLILHASSSPLPSHRPPLPLCHADQVHEPAASCACERRRHACRARQAVLRPVLLRHVLPVHVDVLHAVDGAHRHCHRLRRTQPSRSLHHHHLPWPPPPRSGLTRALAAPRSGCRGRCRSCGCGGKRSLASSIPRRHHWHRTRRFVPSVLCPSAARSVQLGSDRLSSCALGVSRACLRLVRNVLSIETWDMQIWGGTGR